VWGNPYPEANLGFSLPPLLGGVAMINGMTGSVLIVDDDPTFRRMAARMIVAIGLAVVGEAETAAAAVAAATALRPDAVLVDVRLPDRDGVALARELTALPWAPRVVLTSSDTEAATASEVQGSGARAFVPKVQLPNAALGELLGGTPP
jgi:DNA-binding NarL/FixJ family response regulator